MIKGRQCFLTIQDGLEPLSSQYLSFIRTNRRRFGTRRWILNRQRLGPHAIDRVHNHCALSRIARLAAFYLGLLVLVNFCGQSMGFQLPTHITGKSVRTNS